MAEVLQTESLNSPLKSKRPHLEGDLSVNSDSTDDGNVDQGLVKEDSILADQVFSNPLIVKEILRDLNIYSLTHTSLVNKLFNLLSREFLRNTSCDAYISEGNPCQDFRNLNALLANSDQVPFNGLDIRVNTDKRHKCLPYEDLSEFTSEILAKIKIQYLAIEWEEESSCISLEIVKEIMKACANSLQGLDLQNSPKIAHLFAQYLKQNFGEHWLPNVDLLSFSDEFFDDDESVNVVEEFVQASPKLKILQGKYNDDCLKFLLPLKLTHTFKEFYYRPFIDTVKESMSFAEESPKLESFTFTTADFTTRMHDFGDDFVDKVAEIVKKICASSEDRLEELTTEHLDLILITDQWSIPALKKLKHLRLTYCSKIDDEEGYPTLRRINWTKHFPTLTRLTISNEIYNFIGRDFYINGNFRANNARQFTCPSVTELCLEWTEGAVNVDQIHMLRSVFPNVKEFFLEHDRQFVSVLNRLWTAWEELEGIHLCMDMKPSSSNYDSIFMGISYQESSYLLQQYKDLSTLEIVPTKPCMLNLKNLKKLVIEFHHKDQQCKGGLSRSVLESVFMSRVTGDLVFKRMPGLTVRIDRDLCKANDSCHLALHHLKPFAYLRA